MMVVILMANDGVVRVVDSLAVLHAAVMSDTVSHERKFFPLTEHTPAQEMHRLIVNGRPGPWTSRHAVAHGPGGLWKATSRPLWDECPRVFFVIPVCEHEMSQSEHGSDSSPPQAVSTSGSMVTEGLVAPSEGTPLPSDDGARLGPATVGELAACLREMVEANHVRGDAVAIRTALERADALLARR